MSVRENSGPEEQVEQWIREFMDSPMDVDMRSIVQSLHVFPYQEQSFTENTWIYSRLLLNRTDQLARRRQFR